MNRLFVHAKNGLGLFRKIRHSEASPRKNDLCFSIHCLSNSATINIYTITLTVIATVLLALGSNCWR